MSVRNERKRVDEGADATTGTHLDVHSRSVPAVLRLDEDMVPESDELDDALEVQALKEVHGDGLELNGSPAVLHLLSSLIPRREQRHVLEPLAETATPYVSMQQRVLSVN